MGSWVPAGEDKRSLNHLSPAHFLRSKRVWTSVGEFKSQAAPSYTYNIMQHCTAPQSSVHLSHPFTLSPFTPTRPHAHAWAHAPISQAVFLTAPHMEPQHLSTVLWSLATLRLRPPKLWLELYEGQVGGSWGCMGSTLKPCWGIRGSGRGQHQEDIWTPHMDNYYGLLLIPMNARFGERKC